MVYKKQKNKKTKKKKPMAKKMKKEEWKDEEWKINNNNNKKKYRTDLLYYSYSFFHRGKTEWITWMKLEDY